MPPAMRFFNKLLGIKSDETYVCAPAPFQYAIADCLALQDAFFDNISVPFQQKRRVLCAALQQAGFTPFTPEGAYYVLAGYEQLGYKSDQHAMYALIDSVGIGAVPGHAFFPTLKNTGMLRFCFAVETRVLEEACERLRALPHTY